MDELGHLFALIFWVILAGLFLRNWQGTNTTAHTVLTDSNTIIGTLEQK